MLQRPNRRSQAAERFSLPGEPTDGDEDQIEPVLPLGIPVAADQVVVRGMVLSTYAVLDRIIRRMTQPDPFFLGYQGMKVASMTIERAILDRRPGAAVERHHWLTAATLRAFRQTRDWMSGVGPVYDSFRHQVVMAEGVPDKLADRERIIARRSWSLRFTG